MGKLAELLAKERAQGEWIIQSTRGKAIDESFRTIIHEPLSNRIALLLLQLALTETINPGSDEALMNGPETELAKATRHVAAAKRIVARQRERIARRYPPLLNPPIKQPNGSRAGIRVNRNCGNHVQLRLG
jgi:hypothetical protein